MLAKTCIVLRTAPVLGCVVVSCLAVTACAPTPVSRDFEVPVIEAAVVEVAETSTSLFEQEPEPTGYAVTFDGSLTFDHVGDADEARGPVTSMHMVMSPSDRYATTERAVALMADDVTLTGTAETISEGRWWVGVSGLTSDECIVLRMTAERRGDGLVGWATLDRAGHANSLSFVAVPMSAEQAPDAG